MKYSYISDKKLRNIMISANRKRRFSTSFLTIPKGTVSNKKIPVYAKQVRKKHLNKVLALQTYMEESQRKSQIKADGKIGNLRGDVKSVKKPKNLKGKRLKSPPT